MTQAKRLLTESYAAGTADGPALRIDREKGIIYGVKALGRFSKNRYVEKSEGTEYSPDAMRGVVSLYEGLGVNVDHLSKRQPAENRSSNAAFGVIRAVRFENDGVYADLHYLTKHPLAECVCEDVEKRMGVYGLSHNAFAGKERFDKATNRLVIESIASVVSLDLVRHAATNRNLWESEMSTQNATPITMRSIIESQMKRFSAPRKKVLTRLLEDDSMSDVVASAVEPDADADESESMWSAFEAAIVALLRKCKNGGIERKEAFKRAEKLFKSHEELTADDEPDDSEEVETPAEKKESIDPELLALRKKDSVRTLCEGLDYVPTKSTMTALLAMDKDSDRRALIAEVKPVAGVSLGAGKVRQTRSGTLLSESVNGAGGTGERNLNESANILRNTDY